MVDKVEDQADYAEAARVLFEASRDRFMRVEQCYEAIDALVQAGFITDPTPANGEQVDRDEMAKRLFWADTMLGENADRIQPEWRDRWWDELATMPLSGPGFLRKWRALAAAATLPTPTEDARERVKVLEEALAEAGRMSFAAASIPEGYIDGWADCVEHIRNAGVRAALVEARHEADTALGNKETDRHG